MVLTTICQFAKYVRNSQVLYDEIQPLLFCNKFIVDIKEKTETWEHAIKWH